MANTHSSELMKYDAFLCHSTRSNGALVARLRHELQMCSRRLFGLRRLHLFQDRFDLGGTPTLWTTLKERLSQSQKLVVILTPESENSPGMAKEIDWWISNRDPKDLCLVALGGDIGWDEVARRFRPGSAVPALLQKLFTEEPFYFDLRGYRGATASGDDFVQDTFWALLGELLGTTADAERRADRRRRRIEVSGLLLGIIAVLAAVFTAINATVDLRVTQALREDAESTIQADRLSASSVSLSERDPSAAATLVIRATEVHETPRVLRQAYRLALRWPFLAGHWSIGEQIEGATTSDADWRLVLCKGTKVWTLDMRSAETPARVQTVQAPDAPWPMRPACRFETPPGIERNFLVIEFVIGNVEQSPVPAPGPTVFELIKGELTPLRQGVLEDNPASICLDPSLDGLSFVRDGAAWLCQSGEVRRMSTEGYDPGFEDAIVEAPGGAVRGFIERATGSGRQQRGYDPASAQTLPQLVVFSPGGKKRKPVNVRLEAGDWLSGLSPNGRHAAIKGYRGRAATSRIGGSGTLTLIDQSSATIDVDAILFPQAGPERWVIQSSTYSGREIDRSFIKRDDPSGDLVLERFSGFRETPNLTVSPSAETLVVLTKAGSVELYRFGDEGKVVERLPPPPGRRFNVCEPVKDENGITWMLILTPAGMAYAVRSDAPRTRISIQHQLRSVSYFNPGDPVDINKGLSDTLPAWLRKALNRRWQAAQEFKVGLSDIRANVDGAVLATLADRGQTLGVMVGDVPVKVPPPANTKFNQYGDAVLQLSDDGSLITAPLENGVVLFTVDRSTAHIEVAATLPAAIAVSFSPDGNRLAIARDLELEIRRLDCGHELTCVTEPDAIEYRFFAHNNGINQVAIDRNQRFLYSGGHDGRLVIHDLETGERIDPDMPLHTDTIDSLCALSEGALSLDQTNAMLLWRLDYKTLKRDLAKLSAIGALDSDQR